MKIHELKRKTKNTKSRLIGRGGTRGKTSGRGGKGQTARAGHKARPEMRDIIKKMPKLRGRGKNINTSRKTKPTVLNLADLELIFSNNETITPQNLLERGLIERFGGRNPRIKILSGGELTKKFIIADCTVSADAKTKIEKAGGSVK